MAALLSGERLRFLFRTEQGRIGRQDWWTGVALLAGGLVVLTAGWFAVAPYTDRTIDESQALIEPATVAAYAYLMAYALAIVLAAVSFTMLSIKRLRDRLRPTGLAGLVPLLALVDGSTRWLQPRVDEVMSRGWVYGADVLLIAAVAWAVYEMGFGEKDHSAVPPGN